MDLADRNRDISRYVTNGVDPDRKRFYELAAIRFKFDELEALIGTHYRHDNVLHHYRVRRSLMTLRRVLRECIALAYLERNDVSFVPEQISTPNRHRTPRRRLNGNNGICQAPRRRQLPRQAVPQAPESEIAFSTIINQVLQTDVDRPKMRLKFDFKSKFEIKISLVINCKKFEA
ncbi:CLUMA_CG011346, isoform A [Clunio marinus]|uniref:CLUMA_CG011346, isoform A n=1 Tax=Clunio marinus TaxID=568069 RepID=A0A1J1IG08_9DIPT|nr:CLUMA_CG011346, isoform A [Clunio marinus]